MVAISRWFDGSSSSIRSGLSSKSLASISRDCCPPENVAAGALEVGGGKAQTGEHLFDSMIDGVGVLVLDLAVELVIAALGPLAVGVVFGLGHLLGGLFELVLELDHRGEARLGDFDQRLLGLEVDFLPQEADPDSRAARRAGRNRLDQRRPRSA